VIIPQGGVQEGSLRANAARFSTNIHSQAYRLVKAANPKFWVHRAIERRQYDQERTARYVAVSQMVRRHLEEFHHVSKQRIHVVPNAIDVRRVDVSQPGAVRCAFRNRLGFEPGDLVGLFVGHNFALKGLRPLIAALGARRRLHPSGRPIHLLVCGSGNSAPYVRMASRLGLGDQIHFLGYYPDIRDTYWSSDFFVQPTYYDPCSLVVLEALACGLPVITTEQNGAGELMIAGKHGFVIQSPGAEDELIGALDAMTDDRARRAMSADARRLGRQQTFDVHVDRLLAVFEEAARAKKSRTPHSAKWNAKAALGPHLGRSKRTSV
jgi:UDP-glucose:(heptosyl)LPS alpha-1,3-glucosyltransferase